MFNISLNGKKKYLKELKAISIAVNIREPTDSILSDSEIRDRIRELRDQSMGETTREKSKKNYIRVLERGIVIESISLLKEVSRRVFSDMVPYDEQVWAGLALYCGNIIEMKNGEGKTLAATIFALLQYLSGKSIHICTPNDYLSSRDANWMGPLYKRLGMTVGLIMSENLRISDNESESFELKELDHDDRKQVYSCDVVYGKTSHFVFDYLSDHHVLDNDDIRQVRGLETALIDEVDYVLIDEARSPCIQSIGINSNLKVIHTAQAITDTMINGIDYYCDTVKGAIDFSDRGISKIEQFLNLDNIYDHYLIREEGYKGIIPAIENSLKARELFEDGVDYIVQDNQIVVVEERTGRPLFGRMYSDGMHQALELKHGLPLSRKTQCTGKISMQKYFQKYDKVVGMTATAKYDANEYKDLYSIGVVVIPSRFENLKVIESDSIYRTKRERLNSVIQEIKQAYMIQQPILVGTLSVGGAEEIAERLDDDNISYEILHAKNHEREAEIIKKAGEKRAVTIAAKMAGRGTDIRLSEGVEELGGLYVIGVERNESRRMDEQLEGRSGRHGKKGKAKFFISLEDKLMVLFGSERIDKMMSKLGLEEGEEIKHTLVDKSIKRAQSKINANDFAVRKNLLDYDNVLDRNRSNMYNLRNNVLVTDDLDDELNIIFDNFILRSINQISRKKRLNKEEVIQFIEKINQILHEDKSSPFENQDIVDTEELIKWSKNRFVACFRKKRMGIGEEIFRVICKHIFLRTLDEFWINHLQDMESLEFSFVLKSQSEQDILYWYSSESDRIFDNLLSEMEDSILSLIMRAVVVESDDN